MKGNYLAVATTLVAVAAPTSALADATRSAHQATVSVSFHDNAHHKLLIEAEWSGVTYVRACFGGVCKGSAAIDQDYPDRDKFAIHLPCTGLHTGERVSIRLIADTTSGTRTWHGTRRIGNPLFI